MMNKILTLAVALFIGLAGYAQCSVSFSSNSTNGYDYNFSSTISGYTQPHYVWSFDNGNSDTTPNPSTSYAGNGPRVVCLTVYDSIAPYCSSSFCDTISISNAPNTTCTAAFMITQNSLTPNGFFLTNNSSSSNGFFGTSWDFGDGNTSIVTNPYHEYTTSGMHHICLTIFDGYGCTDTYCDSVYVAAAPCVVSFTNSTINGTDFNFNASATNVTNATYSWDFGDGNTGNGINPTHTYASNGTYNVCVTVTDNAAPFCSSTFCDIVTVTQSPNCNAVWSSLEDSLNPGTFVFSNSSTGTGLSYFWDFGDGNTSTLVTNNHVYTTNGAYVVCLTVSNSLGCSDTHCDTVVVTSGSTGGGCSASFVYFLDTTAGPSDYIINSSISGSGGYTYTWDYGDGTTGTGLIPQPHVYPQGTFLLCLTITDGQGCSDTHCETLMFGTSGGSIKMGTVNSVDDISFEVSKLYPNPAQDQVFVELNNIKGENLTISVTDMIGKTVVTKQVNAFDGNGLIDINVTNLNSGLYVVNIVGKTSAKTLRFVKK